MSEELKETLQDEGVAIAEPPQDDTAQGDIPGGDAAPETEAADVSSAGASAALPAGYDGPPVEATSRIDQKAVEALSRQVILSNKALYVLYGAMMAILAGVGVFVLLGIPDAMFVGIVLIIVGILVPPVAFIFTFLLVQKTGSKSFQVLYNTVQHFTFADFITVCETSDVSHGKTNTYAWARVVKAVEKKEYFFLFLATSAAFIVEKSGFSAPGTADDFRAMLKARLGAKFK
ncbi:MAG: YcxB family protein [Firmicutes bacterium]|nr:YcxB family protein [Bacillota bacterium]